MAYLFTPFPMTLKNLKGHLRDAGHQIQFDEHVARL